MRKRNLLRSFVKSCLLLIVLLAGMGSQQALAVQSVTNTSTDTTLKIDHALNDLFFYEPNEGCNSSGAASSGSTALSGKGNLEKIYNYMLGKGLSDVQAAGVVGNISQESGGDPTIIQGGSHSTNPNTAASLGWGIIQWTPGGKVIGIAQRAGIKGIISELSTQLDILWWHMTNTSPTGASNMLDHYKTITDVSAAAREFEAKVEGAGTPNMTNRIAAAKLALSYTKSVNTAISAGSSSTTSCACPTTATTTAPAATPTSSTDTAISTTTAVVPSGGCGAAVAGNAVATAVAYAWPDYHPAPYTDLKPAYAEAVKRTIAAKGYLGGLPGYPGVDCGAFVTRVMQDSGVDPTYNKGKGPTGSPSSGQWGYLISSGKYVEVHPKSTADALPGDIAINSGHTYMYVGKVPGFNSTLASSSISWNGGPGRAPMAGKDPAPGDPSYHWFRLTSQAV